MKKRHGHYCRICGSRKPNEAFSGKGHRIHVCKVCSRMPKMERASIEQKDEIFNLANNSAKDRVKVSFLMNRIAEKEGIRIEQDEIMQRILYIAHQNKIKPEQLIKQLKEQGGISEIHNELLSNKVLDFLELNAQVGEVAPVAPAES